MVYVISTILLPLLFCAGLALGLRIMAMMQAQFDALLPERMVDYCGYVDVTTGTD